MALIGISGHISSGKDLVGSIIRYCFNTKWNHPDAGTYAHFETFVKLTVFGQEWENDWEIKKFAGKVKEICSILTGIPIADFEKQEVKDRVLGEEWVKKKRVRNYTKYKYGSGFDTIVQHLTVRQLLQQVGTDAMRNVIHPNVWVNALFADYKVQGEINVGKTYSTKDLPNWIITDTRFVNEAEAIKSRGGLLIRVNRTSVNRAPILADLGKIMGENTTSKMVLLNHGNEHPSETALDSYTGFDEVIDNNGTIEELIEKVKQILIKYKII